MKKRISLLFFIVLILFIAFPIMGICAYNENPRVADFLFIPDKTVVNRGDTITFNVEVNELPEGLDMLTGVGFIIAYDGEFFENFSSRISYGTRTCEELEALNYPNVDSLRGKELIYVGRSIDTGLGNVFSFSIDVKENTTLNSGIISLWDDESGESASSGLASARFRNTSYPITITVGSQNPDNPTPDDPTPDDPTPTTVAVKGITISPTSKEMNVGDTFTIQPTINPSNATNKNITWSSSNSNVASVSSSGKVTAKAEGAATITAKTNDGNFTATCTVTVSKVADPDNPADPSSEVKVTGVTIDKPTATIKTGEKLQLTAVVAPKDATNKNVIWSSSDTSIATVSTNGLVTGLKKGQAKITVKTVDGSMAAEATISVTDGDIVIDIEDNKQNSGGTSNSGGNSNSGTKDSTTAKDKIPQTGESFIIVTALIIASSVAIISYRKIRMNRDIK